MIDADALFGHGPQLTVAQECARAVLVFGYGLVAVRVAGRRVFGKWSAIDIVVSVVIGSNLSRAITGSAQLSGTLAASTLILALHWLLAAAAARAHWASVLFEGRAVDLGAGATAHRRRVRHAVSQADLDEALRQKGLNSADQAGRITLEPSGAITVVTREG